ncbi:MAG: DNA sulfur modification protein DndB [Sporichthyaceae bacterium]
MTVTVQPEEFTHPLVIENVQEVDDAGGTHYEAVMTGGFLVGLQKSEMLTLTGNIRPDHDPSRRMLGKTKTKINQWTEELLANRAIVGNLSIRLDPTKARWEVYTDPETGNKSLAVHEGEFDCAVDSQSRLTAVFKAADNPLQSFELDTKFAVRIWMADDDKAKQVAVLYNTRGDKVNDSTAKYAWAGNKVQEIARRLVNGSEHLGQANVEVLANSVSASSNKLCSFNTISKALEDFWEGGPQTDADVEGQSAWLISAWDSLVMARPEFGILATPARKAARKTSIASTAVGVHGVLAVMSDLHVGRGDPALAFKKLIQAEGEECDFLALANPIWQEVGVVVPSESEKEPGKLGTRSSFPARRAVAKLLRERMGIKGSEDE